jgi:hypothetical protein
MLKHIQKTMVSPNTQRKVPEIDQIAVRLGEYSELKTVILRKLNELEENTKKCFNAVTEIDTKQRNGRHFFKKSNIVNFQNMMEDIHSRMYQIEERISKLKDRLFEDT